ncbi:MAG: zf-HC2 domain-containing protein, partial [bacterium]
MRCKKVEWLLSDYVDGTLDAPTRAILEEHLHSCQACKSSLRRLERTVRLVKDAPMPQPPEYYWSDFTPHLMERLRREEEAGKAWKAWLSELFWTRRPAIVVTSAAAMAVVLSVFLIHERSKRPEESGRAGAVSILDVPYVTMPHSSIRTVDAA